LFISKPVKCRQQREKKEGTIRDKEREEKRWENRRVEIREEKKRIEKRVEKREEKRREEKEEKIDCVKRERACILQTFYHKNIFKNSLKIVVLTV